MPARQRLCCLGVGLWLASSLGGCRGEYPLEPSPCDDWCHALDTFNCGDQDPANCVTGCEASNVVPDKIECQGLWRQLLDCYERAPGAAGCGDVPTLPGQEAQACEAERAALTSCAVSLPPR